MTSVFASYKDDTFTIDLKGHAEGKDPKICTAISTLTSALELYCANHDIEYSVEKGSGRFRIRFAGDKKECKTIYDFVVFALYEIQHDFDGYIEVKMA